MSASHPGELHLLYRRVAEGSEAAFRQLVDHHAPRLLALAARITGSAAVADDLVQDTFLKVWLSRDQLTEVEHPEAWIKKICFFLAINHLRRQQLRSKIMDVVEYRQALDAHGLPAEELAEFHQLLALLHQAVRQLPAKQQLVYQLSREQGLSIAEIAEQMGLAASTVKNLMVMALKNIRTALQHAGYPLLVAILIDLLV
ncbi:RNA polymerase sigma factor [Chitinophaga parva]|uniref:RNA polymerase sigma factor n=1 Tax=Chitinophaga parva TaxID=2169414 RepID=UPI0014032B5D|nr:sigma-70 family RNA polymerase sigma factor [Chitinophaga parva]